MATYRLLSKDTWEVDFGNDINGKRIKRIVHSEKEAKRQLAEFEKAQKRNYEWWFLRTKIEQASIVSVCSEIMQAGHTLSEVWHKFQEDKKAGDESIKPKTIEDAIRAWRALKTQGDEDWLDEEEDFLWKFCKGQEKRHVHKFTHEDVQKLEAANPSWSDNTKLARRRLLSSVWNTFKRQGFTKINITDRLEPLSAPAMDIRIYPNDDVLHMMAAAVYFEEFHPLIGLFTLGYWGCMRPEEITDPPPDKTKKQFGWWCIDLQYGRIPLEKGMTKNEDVRTVRMHKTCQLWLEYAKTLGVEFPPPNHRKLRVKLCKLVDVVWIRDGCRKNCATHLRNHYKNDYEVVQDMGNSVRVLLENYAKLNTPEAISKAFFDITPKKVMTYIKSKAWQDFLSSVAEATPPQSANETSKGAR